MTIEVSPRISFSNDLCPSPSFSNSSRRVERAGSETISSSELFHFSTTYEFSLDNRYYSTPADLLFSQGKLLPLNKSSPVLPKHDQTTFWRDSTRSSSASKNTEEEGPTVLPFQRSKSTGYSPNQKKPYGSKSSPNSKNYGKAYYYPGDRRLIPFKNGVRIDPVINVPATFIPRGGSAGSSSTSSGSCTSAGGGGGGGSFFAYLLCNCRGKNMEMDDNEGV